MFLDFKKWVKSIQTEGYNGARTAYQIKSSSFGNSNSNLEIFQSHWEPNKVFVVLSFPNTANDCQFCNYQICVVLT